MTPLPSTPPPSPAETISEQSDPTTPPIPLTVCTVDSNATLQTGDQTERQETTAGTTALTERKIELEVRTETETRTEGERDQKQSKPESNTAKKKRQKESKQQDRSCSPENRPPRQPSVPADRNIVKLENALKTPDIHQERLQNRRPSTTARIRERGSQAEKIGLKLGRTEAKIISVKLLDLIEELGKLVCLIDARKQKECTSATEDEQINSRASKLINAYNALLEEDPQTNYRLVTRGETDHAELHIQIRSHIIEIRSRQLPDSTAFAFAWEEITKEPGAITTHSIGPMIKRYIVPNTVIMVEIKQLLRILQKYPSCQQDIDIIKAKLRSHSWLTQQYATIIYYTVQSRTRDQQTRSIVLSMIMRYIELVNDLITDSWKDIDDHQAYLFWMNRLNWIMALDEGKISEFRAVMQGLSVCQTQVLDAKNSLQWPLIVNEIISISLLAIRIANDPQSSIAKAEAAVDCLDLIHNSTKYGFLASIITTAMTSINDQTNQEIKAATLNLLGILNQIVVTCEQCRLLWQAKRNEKERQRQQILEGLLQQSTKPSPSKSSSSDKTSEAEAVESVDEQQDERQEQDSGIPFAEAEQQAETLLPMPDTVLFELSQATQLLTGKRQDPRSAESIYRRLLARSDITKEESVSIHLGLFETGIHETTPCVRALLKLRKRLVMFAEKLELRPLERSEDRAFVDALSQLMGVEQELTASLENAIHCFSQFCLTDLTDEQYDSIQMTTARLSNTVELLREIEHYPVDVETLFQRRRQYAREIMRGKMVLHQQPKLRESNITDYLSNNCVLNTNITTLCNALDTLSKKEQTVSESQDTAE